MEKYFYLLSCMAFQTLKIVIFIKNTEIKIKSIGYIEIYKLKLLGFQKVPLSISNLT